MYNNRYERCCQAEGLHQLEGAPVESRRHASLRRVHGGHGAEDHTVLAAVARGTAGAGPPIRSGAVHARGGVDADSQSAAADRSGLASRSEEHTSELQSQFHLVCRLLLEKKKKSTYSSTLANKNKIKIKQL